jgi:putative transposase
MNLLEQVWEWTDCELIRRPCDKLIHNWKEHRMPFCRLFYHLVWATKNRLPLIGPKIEEKLHAYLCQKAGELDCRVFAVNGWQDHVHLVISIPPKLSISEVVKRLKGASSNEFPDLYWQRGYGALSVSERNLGAALEYVKRQKEHHMQQTAFLKLERCDDDLDEGNGLKDEIGVYGVEGMDPF